MANATDLNINRFPNHSESEASRKTNPESANVADKAKELASAVSDKSKELASAVAQAATSMAKDAASTVAAKASDVAATVGRTAEDATSSVGGGLKSFAQTIRDRGPHDGMMGSATSALAGTLQSGGEYLQEEGLQGMADDVSDLVRRYPLKSVLVGIGIGYCLARLTRS